MNYLFATKFFLLCLVFSVFGQNFSFTNSPHADQGSFAEWTSWDITAEEANIKAPTIMGEAGNQTNLLFSGNSYSTNDISPYIITEGVFSDAAYGQYGFSPSFQLQLDSDDEIDYVSWQVYHMAISSAGTGSDAFTNIFQNAGITETNVASILYDSVMLSSGTNSNIAPTSIDLFYDSQADVDYHGGQGSFPYHGTIFVWELEPYSFSSITIDMVMGHTSNKKMRVDYADIAEASDPTNLDISISNNLAYISFNSDIGQTYEVHKITDASGPSNTWSLQTNIVAETAITTFSHNFDHDSLFWYVNRID